MNKTTRLTWRWLLSIVTLLSGAILFAQEEENTEDEIYELDPFVVVSDENVGYLATHTLAGTQIRTELKDVGSAITVVTEEFLRDTGATDNQSLLVYTPSTEIGTVQGNFTGVGNTGTLDESNTFVNPSQNTRVRGLDSADNTRDYFLSDIPWDGYNVGRVEMQRGPNSILFGLGSPAGIINTGLDIAEYRNEGEVAFRFGSHGSYRASFNINKVILDDELAVRVAGVRDDTQFRQDPAYELDERLFLAIKWDPKFLQSASMKTTLRVNFENGDIARNSPRTLPPVDLITPWFTEMDQAVYDPIDTQDNYSLRPGAGARRENYEDGSPNPYYEPWVGHYAQIYGGPLFVFDSGASVNPSFIYMTENLELYGLGPDGSEDGDIGGLQYQRLNGVAQYQQYANNLTRDDDPGNDLPFSEFGQYKNFQLQNSSVFDFYNNLIDGPNKREWEDWKAYNVTFSQSFFSNRLAYELVKDRQIYGRGQVSLLNGQRQAIFVDINSHFADGSPNPNVGRAFVSDSYGYGNGSYDSIRDTFRAKLYGKLDFADFMDSDSFITKLLGQHDFTAVYTEQTSSSDSRNWHQYGTDPAYGDVLRVSNMHDNWRHVNTSVYIGPSLIGSNLSDGLNLPRLTAQQIPTSGQILWYDSHWNADASVDPGTAWIDLNAEPNTVTTIAYEEDDEGNPIATDPWDNLITDPAGYTYTGRLSTESENPDNYVGWSYMPVGILSADDGAKDQLTTSAQYTTETIKSRVGVWQGYWWDGAIVTTYGYRKDEAASQISRAPTLGSGNADLNAYGGDYLPAPTVVKGPSESYSVVGHIDELVPFEMPFKLSGYYNYSENFRPAASRVNLYGHPLAPPTGVTRDKGILISTLDGRYSLKVNWYETSVQLASSNAISAYAWYLAANIEWGRIWSNRFFYDDGPDWQVNFQVRDGLTADETAALESAAIQAFRDNLPSQEFLTAWNILLANGDTSDDALYGEHRYDTPPGFTATEDTVSEGIEFEFTANPVSNWNITANISKTFASRSNVGGVELNDYVEERTRIYNDTPAGDMRIWWGGGPDLRTDWQQRWTSNYALVQLLEGTAVPELRKYRFNLVTNYSFEEGRLQGFNVGGSYRWQDGVIIGYPLIDAAGETTYDLANPYYGPAETSIDMWCGYEKDVTETLTWRIQLNVRNLFASDDLIPITTQPDGTWAGVRIPPNRVWMITNTFTF